MAYLLGIILIVLVVIFLREMRRSLSRSSVTNALVQEYAGELTEAREHELMVKILDFCREDRKLKPIIEKYGADEAKLRRIYHKLRRHADFVKGRRYVPISSFFYVYTLEHLLKNPDEDAKKMTMRCMNFFHI